MAPLLNHENIGEIQKIAYLTATITSVDSANDTACFEGVGTCPSGTDVIIFYHCEPDSVLRDNGALEGAAGAFSVDDEVIVQCEITGANRYAPLRVMGFTDKPKECGFGFKLTRGDETLITEDSELLTYIRLYNSDNISLSITELVYTPVPKTGEDIDGYWSFNLADSADADKDGYWVDYLCEDGIATQYPYRYKDDDKDKEADLIPMGTYEDIIPYWVTISSYVNMVLGDTEDICSTSLVPTYRDWLNRFLAAPGGFWGKKLNIKSSVSYQVRRYARSTTSQLRDFYFVSVKYEGGGCCTEGSGCLKLASNASALITGGGLSVVVTSSNIFDESAEEIVAGSISGEDHDMILTDTTSGEAFLNCTVDSPPTCTIVGAIPGTFRSLRGAMGLLSIYAYYDY